jgi:hypothetical protein
MFPEPSGATTPVAPIASKPQELENHNEDVDGGRPTSWPGTESAPVRSPEPHWDSVIGAATD